MKTKQTHQQIKSHISTSKLTTVKRTPALNTGKVKSTKNTRAKRRGRNAKKEKTAAQTPSLTNRTKKAERKRSERRRKRANMPTKPRGQAHDLKALQHLILNLNANQNLLVKIQSQQVRLSSKTNPLLISLRSYPTLFPRLRLRSTKAQKKKDPKKRKEAPAEHPKVRRPPREEEADLDHPDGDQDTDPDHGL